MSNLPPPQFPPPQPPGGDRSNGAQPPSTPRSDITELVDQTALPTPTPWFRRTFLKLPVWVWSVAVVSLVGAGVAVALSGGDDEPSVTADTSLITVPSDDTAPGSETTVAASEPTITEPLDTTAPTEPPVTEPPADQAVAGAPAGERGTQAAPVAPGSVADIGDGWRMQVLEFVGDGTAAVAAENEFNEPPPAGSTFTLVKVALGYYGLADPATAFTPTINALGAGKVQLDTSCGLIPDELPVFTDLFAGGVVVGNLCFVTTPADAAGILLYATADFFGDDVFLAASAPATAPTVLPTLDGPQPGAAATAGRTSPVPVGTAQDVGEGWTLTVTGAARDITDAVLADNSFSEPPPAGSRFVGVEVTYAYSGDGSDVAYTATTKAVAGTNVELPAACGSVPGEVDLFSDVFAGGSVSGTLCFVVPEGVTGLVLYTTVYADDVVHEYFAAQ